MAGSRYSFLFKLDPKDYKAWAYGLKKAGYATDPTYGERLIKIIEDFKLMVYDEYADNRKIASIVQEPAPEPSKIKPTKAPLGKTNAKHKIEMRNGKRTIVVGEGDSYESLSKELGLKDWELHTYNDFAKGRQPRVNEILYLSSKHKKANKQHKQHVAENGDTMHYIAQRYALKLRPLLKRNRMKSGEEPVAGQIIYLRNKKPRKG